MTTKTCIICGKTFTSYSANQKYCSAECRMHRPYPKICKGCGKPFLATQGNRKQYCSEDCRLKALGRRSTVPGKLLDGPVDFSSAKMRLCKIRVAKEITSIWPEYRPERGSVHDAERWTCILTANGNVTNQHDGYIIVCGGKRIPIRATECEEVET
jgi:hypothetical protein